jgi:outer membrane protein assembly factor BamB
VTAQRAIRLLASLVVMGLIGACSGGARSASKPASPANPRAVGTPGPGKAPTFTGAGVGHLATGSHPEVLPGPVLIADEGNDRLLIVDPHGRVAWTFPQPGDLPAGVEFKAPDDAFFTPDGRQIIATEEEYSVVTLIDIASRKIVWRYGTPGNPGAGPDHLSNPDDAIVLRNGAVLLADIKNCRLLLFDKGARQPRQVYGTTGSCFHDPPARYGSPNGAFPMRNGHYLVTEINGDWVDEIDLSGKVYASTQPPGIAYPSDTNEVTPGTYLTVDYSDPGQIETFNASGTLLWRYQPTGALSLNHPSLALPLPNGDVLATDDHNDRIIVIDPKTNQIVWQYGQRSQPGTTPGLLNGPDGLDLAPPHSDLVVHAKTMGLPG